ncbi:CvpA family protein [Albirhodobacter sp. R86504]|jgi:membrane protein required for colicin V production|uniref:CvpA family protein n=1 Tax=Albirhodobacter sp. R86504 TaxID=3093848 RepID=UPI00366B88EA
MDGFTIIDAIVAGVIVISAILAYSRGFVREALSILGWVAAAIVGFVFADAARPLIAQIPVINKVIGDSCELGTIGGFAAVFAIALVIAGLITPLFSSIISRSALSAIDQGLGFLFGVVRGVLIIAVAFALYDQVIGANSVEMVDASRSAKVFSRVGDRVEGTMPDDAPGWIVARYEQLISQCEAPATPVSAPASAN